MNIVPAWIGTAKDIGNVDPWVLLQSEMNMPANHSLERAQPQRAMMDGIEVLRRSARNRSAAQDAIPTQDTSLFE